MGASTSGHPAAALAVETVRSAFEAGLKPARILSAVSEANGTIFARAEAAQRREPGSDVRWLGMGTTAEVAVFVSGRAHLAHVGDGTIYRLRNGGLESMTIAHTLVNDYRRLHPELTEAELKQVPQRVIVRALGMKATVTVDLDEVETRPGDIWLVCSDGLTNLLSDEEIAAILRRDGSSHDLARALLAAAIAVRCPPGEKDNITLIVHVVEGTSGGRA